MKGKSVGAALAIVALALMAAPAAHGEVTVTPSFTILEVAGGPGDDRIGIRCEGDRVIVNGAPAAAGRVRCSKLRDLDVEGRRGDDRIFIEGIGRGFFDQIFNEDGLDLQITGGPGDDRIYATIRAPARAYLGPGDDRFTAPDMALPAVYGGPGDDRIITGTGGGAFAGLSGTLAGGSGQDRIWAGGRFAFLLGGPGPDRIRGFRGSAFAYGGDGPDTLTGGPGMDILLGNSGNDFLAGQNDRDLLAGMRGRDRLFGGPGRDALVGGPSRDRLGGGPGRDIEAQDGVPDGLGPFGAVFEFILAPGPAEEEESWAGYAPLGRRALALLERGHRQAR